MCQIGVQIPMETGTWHEDTIYVFPHNQPTRKCWHTAAPLQRHVFPADGATIGMLTTITAATCSAILSAKKAYYK